MRRYPKNRNMVMLSVLLVLVAVFAWHTIDETDAGFHLRMGRWILENGKVPQTDPLTYTVFDHTYVDMHWLYQIVVWSVLNAGGLVVYTLIHVLCIVFAFYHALGMAVLRKAHLLPCLALGMVGIVASEFRFSVRPEVVSWLFLVLVIRCLESFKRNRSKCLWCIPLLMLLWVNIQGIYVIGLLITGIYIVDDLIKNRSITPRLWLTGAASVFVCLINPYGLKGLSFPFILAGRLGGDNQFALSIAEFRSPWHFNPLTMPAGQTLFLWCYYALAVTIPFIMLLTARKRTPAEWLSVAVFGILAAQAIRNIPLFVLVSIPIGSDAVTTIGYHINKRRCSKQKLLAVSAAVVRNALMGTALILILFGINGTWVYMTGRPVRFGTGLSEYFLPVNATGFLSKNRVKGRIVNELRYGGYLSWQWNEPVFIDGRLEVMEHDFFEAYDLSRRLTGPADLIKQWQPDLAVFGYRSMPLWFHFFHSDRNWRLVHLDTHTAVYFHTSFRNDIPELTPETLMQQFSETNERIWLTSQTVLHKFRPASKTTIAVKYFTGLPVFPRGNLNKAGSLEFMRAVELAEQLLLQALVETGGFYRVIWERLGDLYFNTGRFDEAQLCYEAILGVFPENNHAALQLERIRIRKTRRPSMKNDV